VLGQLAHLVEAGEGTRAEGVQVGGVTNEARTDELDDALLAETLDVHGEREAKCTIAGPAAGAVDVRAVGVALAL